MRSRTPPGVSGHGAREHQVVALDLEVQPVLEAAVADPQLVLVCPEVVVERALHVGAQRQRVGVDEQPVPRPARHRVAVVRVHAQLQLVPGTRPGPGHVQDRLLAGVRRHGAARQRRAVEQPRVVHVLQPTRRPVADVRAPDDRLALRRPAFMAGDALFHT
jgi:hypothetical protein